MVNRLYFVCSWFFLGGAVVARWETASLANDLYLVGAIFFFLAAMLGVIVRKR